MDDRGSGTIDTHAVGAMHFQPYSGKSIPVSHNFGVMATKGVEGAAKVGAFGSKGMYGINLEAYILAAQERNVLPREMQSITWEAVRGLFTPQFKTKENVAKITEIWDSYRAGEKTLDQTRQEVIDYATQKQKPNSLVDQIGKDPLVEAMEYHKIPVTRDNYLEMAYPDGVPEMTAELEEQLPKELRLNPE